MIRFVTRRLLNVLATLAGVLLLTFVTFHGIGGSPAEVILGQNAAPETLAAFERRHGYDKPLFFGHWSRVRALEDRSFRPGAFSGEIAFRYPLSSGTYRLVFRTSRDSESGGADPLRLHVNLTGQGAPRTVVRPLEGRGERAWVDFTVPPGNSALGARLVPSPGTVRELRLRRKTGGGFDSQFVHFMADLLRGDLGYSVSYGRPVAEVLRDGIGPSLALTVPIFCITLFLSLAGGTLCAAFRGGRVDRAILAACAVLMSVNYVAWVIGGQYLLAYRLGWFPVWGFESWRHVILPVIVGVLSGLGRDLRYYRTVLLDEARGGHVRAAIARGLPPWKVWTRHVLRNSLIPIVTQISMILPFLFMGSLLLESFFGIPGIGGVSINAIQSGDMSVVRAVVILGAFLYQGILLGADLLSAWLDPRVRVA